MSRICACAGKDFPGNCHCTVCCLSFTAESTFYKHLVVDKGRIVEHLDPTDAGLELKKTGMWGGPAPDDAPWRT